MSINRCLSVNRCLGAHATKLQLLSAPLELEIGYQSLCQLQTLANCCDFHIGTLFGVRSPETYKSRYKMHRKLKQIHSNGDW